MTMSDIIGEPSLRRLASRASDLPNPMTSGGPLPTLGDIRLVLFERVSKEA